MQIHELKLDTKRKPKRRVGRGIAAGQGKTAGRGTKGQNSRSGANIPLQFEGGQLAFSQRFPKLRGFKNIFAKKVLAINLEDLEKIGKAEISREDILAYRDVKNNKTYVKILGSGTVKKVKVFADFASKTAVEAIKKAGGEIVLTPKLEKVKKLPKKIK